MYRGHESARYTLLAKKEAAGMKMEETREQRQQHYRGPDELKGTWSDFEELGYVFTDLSEAWKAEAWLGRMVVQNEAEREEPWTEK